MNFNCACLQINTWSRTAYVQPLDPQPPADGEASLEGSAVADDPSTRLIQEWTNIDNNFVMVRVLLRPCLHPTVSRAVFPRQ